MVDRFIKWGVPMPRVNVYISGVTELAGGILLMLGLGTRLISVPLVFNFIVAIVAASRNEIANAFRTKGIQDGWDQIVNDTAFPFLIMSLVMLAFGAGIFSIDDLLGRKLFCKNPPSHRGFAVEPPGKTPV
jgi:putative oxidoreductase